jgi:predicted AAA+ superfamily ATPase
MVKFFSPIGGAIMIGRHLTNELNEMSKVYPVVTLLGPRQSGKTTLVRTVFINKPYVNLEQLEARQLAIEDPQMFLDQYPEGAVLDEIQRAPTLLSYIQVIVDEKKEMGQFILTGSHQLSLHEAISQSLAGRTAMLKLLPLSMQELKNENIEYNLEELILKGGFAKLYGVKLAPDKYYSHYCQTYIERDVRQLINVKDLLKFQSFMRMCAARIGRLWNASQISNELGISVPTVNEWLSVLEASFLVFRLPPYHRNYGKRITKTPKLYFTDVGLVSYLLGIETEKQVARDPCRGFLVENLVIVELLKYRYNEGKEARLYYYLDQSQNEVDVIVEQGHLIIPIEIKAGQTFRKDFLKGLIKFQEISNSDLSGYVVYTGSQTQKIQKNKLINYKDTANILIDSSSDHFDA